MDKNASDDTSVVSVPEKPLWIEWPSLERAQQIPKKEKKPKNNWKKYHNKKKKAWAGIDSEESSPQPIQLDKSLIATPEEQEVLMQLMTLFDQMDVAVIVSVLRGANGNMEKAIDQLLILHDEMEKQSKKENQVKHSQEEISEGVSDSFLSKQERLERDVSLDESDLEVDDFEELVEDDEDDDSGDWSQQESLQASYQSVGSDSSVYSFAGEDSVKSSISEKYRIHGEDIELPAVPTQDSEVEKWLKEFDLSSAFRKVSELPSESLIDSKSLSDSKSLTDSCSLTDSQTTLESSFPLLGDSNPLNESVPELIEDNVPEIQFSGSQLDAIAQFGATEIPEFQFKLSLESPKEGEKPYFFALDERTMPSRADLSQRRTERHSNFMMRLKENKLYRQKTKLSRRVSFAKDVGTLTISQPIVSTGVDPKEHVETVSLEDHQKKIEEMDSEKKRALSWCVDQMMQMRREAEEKDLVIEAQQKQIQEQQDEIVRLNQKLLEVQSQESKLETLLTTSKDIIVEGVQSLQKSIASSDWVIVEKVKEVDILEKMTQFAGTLKEEISSAFSEIQKASIPDEQKEEELSHQEEKQIWMGEKVSLESYIEELKKKITELEKRA